MLSSSPHYAGPCSVALKELESVLLFLNPLLYHFRRVSIVVGIRWGIDKDYATFIHLGRAEHYVGFHRPYSQGIWCVEGLLCSDVDKLEATGFVKRRDQGCVDLLTVVLPAPGGPMTLFDKSSVQLLNERRM